MATSGPSEYVTLESTDGFEFKILRSAACLSGALKKAFDPSRKYNFQVSTFFHATCFLFWKKCAVALTENEQMDSRSRWRVDMCWTSRMYICLILSPVLRICCLHLTPRSGVVVEKICEYLYYKQKYAEAKDVPDMDVPAELCLELVVAADYLDC